MAALLHDDVAVAICAFVFYCTTGVLVDALATWLDRVTKTTRKQ